MTTPDTRRDDFDRLMVGWMESDAHGAEPEQLLGRVLERTSRVSRIPAWLLPERWIPVQLSMRWQAVPRLAPLLLVLGLLIAAALTALVVGSRPKLPDPFGLAANGRIAYVSGGDLVTSAPDGSDVRAVDGGANAAAPAFSRDGSRIAFKRIAPGSTTEDPTLFGDLVVADPDGANPVVIAAGLEGMSPTAWSPDSRTLLYSAALDGVEQIFVAAADGSSPPVRIGPRDFSWGPRWSPDGRSIAFFVGNEALWVMRADGSQATRTTSGAYREFDGPSWKPDGSAIVFAAKIGTLPGHDVFIAGLDGEPERRLTTSPMDKTGASWSPDGNHLVYLRALTDTTAELVVADAAGDLPRTLPGEFTWHTPQWSPDGARIGAVTAGPDPKLVLVDAVGTGPSVEVDIASPQPGAIAVVSEPPSWQRVAP